MNHPFILRFPVWEIPLWASEYGEPGFDEDVFLEGIHERVIQNRGLAMEDFRSLCKWKTPRSQPLVAQNRAEDVRALTWRALQSANERLKVDILLSLTGVSWPTASVLLHVSSGYQYPILDWRALWSLGYDSPPTYNHLFWAAYTEYCRQTAKDNAVTLRTLDRALWAYSKENQNA